MQHTIGGPQAAAPLPTSLCSIDWAKYTIKWYKWTFIEHLLCARHRAKSIIHSAMVLKPDLGEKIFFVSKCGIRESRHLCALSQDWENVNCLHQRKSVCIRREELVHDGDYGPRHWPFMWLYPGQLWVYPHKLLFGKNRILLLKIKINK